MLKFSMGRQTPNPLHEAVGAKCFITYWQQKDSNLSTVGINVGENGVGRLWMKVLGKGWYLHTLEKREKTAVQGSRGTKIVLLMYDPYRSFQGDTDRQV